MPEFQNRTLICSVLFIDIVDYSRKPVVEQSRLKDRFNALLSEALRGVAINDRIILDTGDGAAISFIGDPEDALFVATGVRDMIAGLSDGPEPELSTRMGINLGPVRLVKDINGQPNIIGDGINVAQRVMTFAKPGQVLVSRSYYEVVSRLSDESSKLFSYEGARTDKHIREHEVYAVGAIPGTRRRFDEANPGEWDTTTEKTSGVARASKTVKGVTDTLVRKPRIATLLAVGAILGVAFGARAYRDAEESIKVPPPHVTAAAPQSPVAPVAPVTEMAAPPPPSPPSPPPITGLPPEPTPPLAQAAPQAGFHTPSERKSILKGEGRLRDKPVLKEEVSAREPAKPAPEAAPAGPPATVSLAVSPWGEVYVNGKLQGVSPPLQELELAPGRHRIELRNSASQPHIVTLTAKPGERLRIKHKFN